MRIKLKLLFLSGSFVLSLATIEIALRLFGWYKPPPSPPTCRSDAHICAIFEPYEPHGYRLRPSLISTIRYPRSNPRTLTVAANKHGFWSSREFDKPDDRPRVLVIGDSLVFGLGVQEPERFTNVLEAMQPKWRVDNLGIPGIGTDLMLKVLEGVGLRLRPDVVVFSIYTHAFRRLHPHYVGMGFNIPRFKLESGRLVTISYPELRFWERTHIFQVMRILYLSYSKATWKLHEAILDRFLELAALHSFAPVIIFMPGTADTKSDKERRLWLRQYAERNRTPFMDLSDPIHKAGQDQAFIEGDPHLSPYGHKLVANELRRFLTERVLNGNR